MARRNSQKPPRHSRSNDKVRCLITSVGQNTYSVISALEDTRPDGWMGNSVENMIFPRELLPKKSRRGSVDTMCFLNGR